MPIGTFLDKEHQPTANDVSVALGSKEPLWHELEQFLAETYAVPGVWGFGGKNYGWNVSYRNGGKALVSLFPRDKSFVAQIVLGVDQVAEAACLKLGKQVATVLRETPQLHDGRWLFIPVKSKQDLKDVQALLQVKRKPKRV